MDPHFDGVIFQTHAAELARRIERPWPPFLVIDVRSPQHYRSGHVPGAVQRTVEQLAAGLPEGTAAGTEFFLVGDGPTDSRPRQASLALGLHGANRRVEFTGGMMEWQAFGLPTERAERAA